MKAIAIIFLILIILSAPVWAVGSDNSTSSSSEQGGQQEPQQGQGMSASVFYNTYNTTHVHPTTIVKATTEKCPQKYGSEVDQASKNGLLVGDGKTAVKNDREPVAAWRLGIGLGRVDTKKVDKTTFNKYQQNQLDLMGRHSLYFCSFEFVSCFSLHTFLHTLCYGNSQNSQHQNHRLFY